MREDLSVNDRIFPVKTFVCTCRLVQTYQHATKEFQMENINTPSKIFDPIMILSSKIQISSLKYILPISPTREKKNENGGLLWNLLNGHSCITNDKFLIGINFAFKWLI